jgi:alpha-galactosidase
MTIQNPGYVITIGGSAENLWTFSGTGESGVFAIPAPVFEIDGKRNVAALGAVRESGKVKTLVNGAKEYAFEGPLAADQAISLRMEFRTADESPVVRFRYVLAASEPRKLTRTGGKDAIGYLSLSFQDCPRVTDVRMAEFLEIAHSYVLSERKVTDGDFADGLTAYGPILAGWGNGHGLAVAFEHGCTVPDAFIRFRLDSSRTATLEAVKGNYWDGYPIGPGGGFATPWLHLAVVEGGERELAGAYRRFILKYQSENTETRKPYIFYNTWNYQERNQAWNGKKYLDSMNQERMLAEIEVAAKMGIEVFVLDTGWYEKTGDWRVSRGRFPDGLAAVRAKLKEHGMKLGLWFNPTVAAVSSKMRKDHEDCLMSWDGKTGDPHQVWETEESQGLCLVSRYADDFADELIRLHRELGVSYFKWDAVGQYGCNAPGHFHGDASASPTERADSYAFQLPGYMGRVVDRLVRACPDAIVDFDITEKGRAVGLGFLASGKLFIINNGPYNSNYDFPDDVKPMFINLFVKPGPARGWICRQALSMDKWIPSILFLTHYLPDDPATSRTINLASLILGQNGIWGDLVGMSPEGVEHFGRVLGKYRQIRDDITSASPVRSGAIGGCPEIHEKINADTGRGAVVIFATERGTYEYVTENKVVEHEWHEGDVNVARDAKGRARITARFGSSGAVIVLFGARQD